MRFDDTNPEKEKVEFEKVNFLNKWIRQLYLTHAHISIGALLS